MAKETREDIELVKSTYQPTKAEVQEEFSPSIQGDSILERMENVARILLRPVNIRWIDRPPK